MKFDNEMIGCDTNLLVRAVLDDDNPMNPHLLEQSIMTIIKPSVEEAKAYIDSIDFSMIIQKIVDTKKWKKSDVVKIATLYKNFLFLNKKYHAQFSEIPPTLEIDEFWHNHILDTKKYHMDCEKIFGEYFHHYPYLGMDGNTNQKDVEKMFQNMQELYHQEFGTYLVDVRMGFFKQLLRFFNLLIHHFKSTK